MKTITQQFAAFLMIAILAFAAGATVNDKRITLRNGKAKENVTLNPSRAYRFVIDGKEFKNLSIELQTSGGNLQVEIKSPSGKILSSGAGKSFSVKRVEQGDYTITLRNKDKSEVAAGYIKITGIDGEAQ